MPKGWNKVCFRKLGISPGIALSSTVKIHLQSSTQRVIDVDSAQKHRLFVEKVDSNVDRGSCRLWIWHQSKWSCSSRTGNTSWLSSEWEPFFQSSKLRSFVIFSLFDIIRPYLAILNRYTASCFVKSLFLNFVSASNMWLGFESSMQRMVLCNWICWNSRTSLQWQCHLWSDRRFLTGPSFGEMERDEEFTSLHVYSLRAIILQYCINLERKRYEIYWI